MLPVKELKLSTKKAYPIMIVFPNKIHLAGITDVDLESDSDIGFCFCF